MKATARAPPRAAAEPSVAPTRALTLCAAAALVVAATALAPLLALALAGAVRAPSPAAASASVPAPARGGGAAAAAAAAAPARRYAPEDAAACGPAAAPFTAVCSAMRSDKCAHHTYQHAYTRLLRDELRCRAGGGRLLEIGLGCGMQYDDHDASAPRTDVRSLDEGRSLVLWLAFLPRAWHVAMFEVNAECVAAFRARDPLTPLLYEGVWDRAALFAGSQLDAAALLRAEREAGPFDIVIDDGGHSMAMQIRTLIVLFPLLAPGGLYIIEDLGTSGHWQGAPGPHPMWDDYEVTAMAYVQHIASLVGEVSTQPPRVTGPFGAPLGGPAKMEHAVEIANMTASVECYTQLCVLRKCPAGKFGSACG